MWKYLNEMPNNGFTILELLLSISLIAVAAGIAVPVFLSFQTRNDLDIAVNILVENLRRAQILSQAVSGDISWGVKIQDRAITLFKGASYASRDVSFDEFFEMQASIATSSLEEIIFEKFSGVPQTINTISLISVNDEMRNIVINNKGIIDY